MLTIHLNGHDEDETPWFYDGDATALFRTARVLGGQHVFVELSPGHLLNVAHIERIIDNVDAETDEPSPLELDQTAREAQRQLDEYDALRRGESIPLPDLPDLT